METPNYLDGIDVIYWINLDRSVDRKLNMEQLFKDDAFKGIPVKRITAFDGKQDPNIMSHFDIESPPQTYTEYAVFLSHLETIRTFKNSNYDVALVFEDDVTLEFKQYWTKSVKKIMADAPQNWDILLLSYMYSELNNVIPFYDWVSCDTNYDSALNKYFSAVAYVINKKGANKLMDSMYSNGKYTLNPNIKHVSDVYIFGVVNSYVYKYPMFIYDTNFESTIHQDHIPYHIRSKENIINNYKNNTMVTALTKNYNRA